MCNEFEDEIPHPNWSHLILAPNIPNSKRNVFVFHSFDIKACDGGRSQQRRFQTSAFSPMVGMVVTISPNLSLYKIAFGVVGKETIVSYSARCPAYCQRHSLVLPAASKPTIKILFSSFENRLSNKRLNERPILSASSSQVVPGLLNFQTLLSRSSQLA